LVKPNRAKLLLHETAAKKEKADRFTLEQVTFFLDKNK